MIRAVDASLIPDTGQQSQTAAAKPAADSSFAVALEKESAKATDASQAAANRVNPPEGETWKPVPGHDDYVEIVSGSRKGQYVDLAKGPHRGETFTIQQREGKLVRVYGEGDKEQVVAIKDSSDSSKKSPHSAKEVKPPKGELWAPVQGHWNYADILNGKRNGFFVNLSSGVRRGMTFLIEHHGGKTYHVYGEGKDRQMIEVRTSSDSSKSGGGSSSDSGRTGGTSGSSTGK